MAGDTNEEKKRPLKSFAVFQGKVLVTTMSTARVLKFLSFRTYYLRTCLKADWRAWVGALISMGCFEKLQVWLPAAVYHIERR
jgi:hypothetical protein